MHFWLIDINDFCEANVSLLKNNNGIISHSVLKFRFCEHVNKTLKNCSTALKSFKTAQTFFFISFLTVLPLEKKLPASSLRNVWKIGVALHWKINLLHRITVIFRKRLIFVQNSLYQATATFYLEIISKSLKLLCMFKKGILLREPTLKGRTKGQNK